MNRGALAVVLVLATIPAVGCGTLVNQSPPGSYFNCRGETRSNRVYGGVRGNGERLGEAVAKIARGDTSGLSSSSVTERDPVTGQSVTRDNTPASEKVMTAIGMTLFFAVDFPLSFVADTVLLPVDAFAQWKRLFGKPPVVEKPRPHESPSVPLSEKQ